MGSRPFAVFRALLLPAELVLRALSYPSRWAQPAEASRPSTVAAAERLPLEQHFLRPSERGKRDRPRRRRGPLGRVAWALVPLVAAGALIGALSASGYFDSQGTAGGSAPAGTFSNAPTHLVVSAPAGATAGDAFEVTVTAKDQYGNTVTDYTGTVHFTSSDEGAGVVLPGNYTFTTADAGVHTFEGGVTLVSAGAQTVTATDTGTSSITGTSRPIAVSAAAPEQLAVTSPSAATAGSPFDVTVTAEDRFGNVTTGYTGTIDFSTSDGGAKVVLPSAYTFVAGDDGTHVFSDGVTLVTAGAQTVTATDTGTSSIAGTSRPILVSAAAADHLAVETPSTATAGSPFTVTVIAKDQFGNTATGYTGTIDFSTSDGGAEVALPSAYTFLAGDAGVHTFTDGVKLVTAGAQTVTVTDTADPSITGTSRQILVSAAAATSIVLSGGSSLPVGTAESLQATITDQFGNTVASGADSSVSIAFTQTGGSGSLSGLAAAGASGGVASDSVGGYSTGTVELQASASLGGGEASSNTLAIAVTPGVASDTLTASQNPTGAGEAVTYKATVSGGGATPSGSVTFYDGDSSIEACGMDGVVALDGSGVATCIVTYASTTPSPHLIAAPYGGDPNYDPAISNLVSEALDKGTATDTLSSNLDPATVGAPVTYTATVAGGGATPTGSVSFEDGGDPIASCGSDGVVGLDSDGKAQCIVSYGSTADSPHSISAPYGGDPNYNGAASNVLSESVVPADQTISFGTLNPSPVTVAGPTYTPVVTASSGLSVAITLDSSSSGCSLSDAGVVSFTAVGTCVIDANQAGNSNWNAAPQMQQSITIGKGSQTISFSTLNPSPVTVGGPTYTPVATASSGLSVAITLDSSSSGCSLSDAGVVSFTAVGTCVIDANQAGDDNWNAAPQMQQSIAVTAAPSADLNAVAGSPDCSSCAWAVGDGGTILYGRRSSFSAEVSGVTVNLNGITAVQGLGGERVWAVGDGGTILECSWSCGDPAAAVWVEQASNTTADLDAVAASRYGGTVWAVGAGGVIDRWNGTTWTPQTVGTHDLLGVAVDQWGSKEWAVGAGGTILESPNGTSWSTQAAPAVAGSTSYTLRSVDSYDPSGDDEVWAVGDGGIVLRTANGGASWTQLSSGGASGSLYGVAASFFNPVYTVGAGGWISTSWDGVDFAPRTSGTSEDLFGVSENAFGDAWAVGADGTILYSGNDGVSWAAATYPTIALTPTTGTAGATSVTIGGSGFAPHHPVTIEVNGVAPATSSCGGTTGSGALATPCTFTIPVNPGCSSCAVAVSDGANQAVASLEVDSAPSFTSADSATFTTGTGNSFTVTSSGYPLSGMSITDAAFGSCTPSTLSGSGIGLTSNGDGTATISATAVASSGTYTLCLNASNGVGSPATQTFTLTVTSFAISGIELDFGSFAGVSDAKWWGCSGPSGTATVVVTCRATGLGPGGVLDGTVSFFNGSSLPGTPVANSTGSAIAIVPAESGSGGSAGTATIASGNAASATVSIQHHDDSTQAWTYAYTAAGGTVYEVIVDVS